MVYVADRENRRVQSFTVDGKFVKQLLKGATKAARLSLSLRPARGMGEGTQSGEHRGAARIGTSEDATRPVSWI